MKQVNKEAEAEWDYCLEKVTDVKEYELALSNYEYRDSMFEKANFRKDIKKICKMLDNGEITKFYELKYNIFTLFNKICLNWRYILWDGFKGNHPINANIKTLLLLSYKLTITEECDNINSKWLKEITKECEEEVKTKSENPNSLCPGPGWEGSEWFLAMLGSNNVEEFIDEIVFRKVKDLD